MHARTSNASLLLLLAFFVLFLCFAFAFDNDNFATRLNQNKLEKRKRAEREQIIEKCWHDNEALLNMDGFHFQWGYTSSHKRGWSLQEHLDFIDSKHNQEHCSVENSKRLLSMQLFSARNNTFNATLLESLLEKKDIFYIGSGRLLPESIEAELHYSAGSIMSCSQDNLHTKKCFHQLESASFVLIAPNVYDILKLNSSDIIRNGANLSSIDIVDVEAQYLKALKSIRIEVTKINQKARLIWSTEPRTHFRRILDDNLNIGLDSPYSVLCNDVLLTEVKRNNLDLALDLHFLSSRAIDFLHYGQQTPFYEVRKDQASYDELRLTRERVHRGEGQRGDKWYIQQAQRRISKSMGRLIMQGIQNEHIYLRPNNQNLKIEYCIAGLGRAAVTVIQQLIKHHTKCALYST